jgi:signal transduction histidine kinase
VERSSEDIRIHLVDFVKVLDFLPYPFMVTEVRDEIQHNIFINKKFLEEIGYNRQELPTIKEWFLLAYPNETYRLEVMSDWFSRILMAERNGHDSVIVQRNIQTKDRGQKWFEIKASLLGPVQFIAFINIDEEMVREDYLAKLNESKDRALSILSHDLRSPLHKLYSVLDLLNQGLISGDETKYLFNRLSSQVFRMMEFVDTTLHWSRVNFESLKIKHQTVDVADICTTVIGVYDNILQEKKVTAELNINKRLRVVTDPEIFAILFRNIFSNAIKYTPVSGVIKVYATRTRGRCQVIIENSGDAIPKEKIKMILSRNYSSERGTAGEKGLGLGLKLCQDLLDKIGGKIEIETPDESHTAFKILIPKGVVV